MATTSNISGKYNLTIFANMLINSPERLQHLKDSFFSFNKISDNWLINIRGSLRNETLDFLRENLGDKIVEFELLNDKKGWGWITNALGMIKKAKHNYILVWNEDHLNIAPQEIFYGLVDEMKKENSDYLLHSWWMNSGGIKDFNVLNLKESDYIKTINLDKNGWERVLKAGYPYYLLSLCGVYKKSFLLGMLKKDRIKLPYIFTKNFYRLITLVQRIIARRIDQTALLHKLNRFSFHIFKRYPKETPFNIEKAPDRFDMLPFNIALSKQELFACIDDDIGMPGYQLIKRGLYPLKKQ